MTKRLRILNTHSCFLISPNLNGNYYICQHQDRGGVVDEAQLVRGVVEDSEGVVNVVDNIEGVVAIVNPVNTPFILLNICVHSYTQYSTMSKTAVEYCMCM